MIYAWVAYGLDMEPDKIIIEMEGKDIMDSHNKAVEFLVSHLIEFDTCELYETNN